MCLRSTSPVTRVYPLWRFFSYARAPRLLAPRKPTSRAASAQTTQTLKHATPMSASRARVPLDAPSRHVQSSNIAECASDVVSRRRTMVSPVAPAPAALASTSTSTSTSASRRRFLAAASLVVVAPSRGVARAAADVDDFNALERTAKQAYYQRDLPRAYEALTKIIDMEPDEAVWLERRAQVLVDLKRFRDAIDDYNKAEAMEPANYRSLGMLSNRALAYEGISDWDSAIKDYSEAIKLSAMIGATPPYVVNSRGNCYVSVGRYDLALEDFLTAADIMQQSRNLSGQIYASSNAALMKAELGDLDGAIRDMEKVSRRAAGSVDMRAALSALYYARGEQERAEETWNVACTMINSGQLVEGGPVLDGCELYRDTDWLLRIRRWPPSVVEKFRRFIELR